VTRPRGAELSSGEIEECFNWFWSYCSAFAESALEFGFKSDETTYWQRRTARVSDYEKQF